MMIQNITKIEAPRTDNLRAQLQLDPRGRNGGSASVSNEFCCICALHSFSYDRYYLQVRMGLCARVRVSSNVHKLYM